MSRFCGKSGSQNPNSHRPRSRFLDIEIFGADHDTEGEVARFYKRQLTHEELTTNVAAFLPATDQAGSTLAARR